MKYFYRSHLTPDSVLTRATEFFGARLAPDARVEVIPHAGHFPHRDHPQRFVRLLHEFIRSTPPASYSRAKFRALLRAGRPIQQDEASVTSITCMASSAMLARLLRSSGRQAPSGWAARRSASSPAA